MAAGFRRDPSASLHIADLTEDMLDDIADDIEGFASRTAAVDTGAMRRSLRTEASPKKREIGYGVDYSVFVEKGTRNMAAQPSLEPALYRHR